MTAATYDAPVEQSGGDDQELEALEDGNDCVDTAEPTAEAVMNRTFLERSLSCEQIPLTLSSLQQAVKDEEVNEVEHRRRWEAGQADYLGKDAFQNIQKMLDRFLD